MTQLPITGGCICGAIRFTATGEPIATRQCWCRDCQYWGAGSSTVNVVFQVADVAFSGEFATFRSRADSGNEMTRGFCPKCGTPVTSASDARPHLVIIRAGTLDNPTIVAPGMNIWTSSAPSWAHIDPALPATPGQPPAPLPQGR